MAVETLSGSAFPTLGRPQWKQRLRRHIIARLRLLRRARRRRVLLAQVMAGTSNPRLIEEAGFRMRGPSVLDLWARTLLGHRP